MIYKKDNKNYDFLNKIYEKGDLDFIYNTLESDKEAKVGCYNSFYLHKDRLHRVKFNYKTKNIEDIESAPYDILNEREKTLLKRKDTLESILSTNENHSNEVFKML